MSSISSSILPASLALSDYDIANYPLLLAGTEYVITFPAGVKAFTMKLRGQADLQIAKSAGLSGSTYFTLCPFTDYHIESVTGANTIIYYVQTSKPNQVIELKYWI